MSGQGKFWRAVDNRAKKTNPAVVSVGVIESLLPFSINYNGINLSVANGDTIYVNNLMLDENKLFTTAEAITARYRSPNDVTVTENHTDIINNITTWLTAIHKRYILDVGDLVAVQKLGNNTYLVLEKLQRLGNE